MGLNASLLCQENVLNTTHFIIILVFMSAIFCLFFFFFFFFLEYKYIELHYADKTSRFASTILRIKGGHSPNQILSRERDKAYFANT
jgi:cell division protein YceG involved in septum cleavage